MNTITNYLTTLGSTHDPCSYWTAVLTCTSTWDRMYHQLFWTMFSVCTFNKRLSQFSQETSIIDRLLMMSFQEWTTFRRFRTFASSCPAGRLRLARHCLHLSTPSTKRNRILLTYRSSGEFCRSFVAELFLIKHDWNSFHRDTSQFRSFFVEKFVDDRNQSSLSYYEFLQHLRTQVK